MKKAPAKTTTWKHAWTWKHAAKKPKHHPVAKKKTTNTHVAASASHVVAKHPHHPKARQWSPDESVACCSARAFAESLRLATGRAVSDSAVLDVYWATAAHADAGASILATAEAVGELAGVGAWRRLVLEPRPSYQPEAGLWPALHAVGDRPPIPGRGLPPAPALILGVDLGEPHTVAVGRDGTWWSWGEPFDPADWPGLVIEEAWAVQWQ